VAGQFPDHFTHSEQPSITHCHLFLFLKGFQTQDGTF